MKKLLIILLVITSSCKEEEIKETFVANALDEYVMSFLSAAAEHGVDINMDGVHIVIDELDSFYGMAYHDEKKIVISSTFFEKNKDYPWHVERLVWHEMGHLMLKREHLNNTIGYINVSVMSTNFGQTYESYRELYKHELFNYY